MSYPSRRRLDPLPQFRDTARSGVYAEELLKVFVIEQYAAGLSLREISELTARSFSAVRNLLDRSGHLRRRVGAQTLVDAMGRYGIKD
jgi:hypothetical protein